MKTQSHEDDDGPSDYGSSSDEGDIFDFFKSTLLVMDELVEEWDLTGFGLVEFQTINGELFSNA